MYLLFAQKNIFEVCADYVRNSKEETSHKKESNWVINAFSEWPTNCLRLIDFMRQVILIFKGPTYANIYI